jgi:hypothetical protein
LGAQPGTISKNRVNRQLIAISLLATFGAGLMVFPPKNECTEMQFSYNAGIGVKGKS